LNWDYKEIDDATIEKRQHAAERRPQRNHNNTMFRYSSHVEGCPTIDMGLSLGSGASWHEVARRIAHFAPLLMAPASRGFVTLKARSVGSPEPLIGVQPLRPV
jgi:5-(hydroxymethyl)furfural/furfural oxidase